MELETYIFWTGNCRICAGMLNDARSLGLQKSESRSSCLLQDIPSVLDLQVVGTYSTAQSKGLGNFYKELFIWPHKLPCSFLTQSLPHRENSVSCFFLKSSQVHQSHLSVLQLFLLPEPMQTLLGEWAIYEWDKPRSMIRNVLSCSASGLGCILHLKHSVRSRASHTEDVVLGWRGKKRKG